MWATEIFATEFCARRKIFGSPGFNLGSLLNLPILPFRICPCPRALHRVQNSTNIPSLENDSKFEDKHIYYQWLHARKAWPTGVNHRVVVAMWVICSILFLSLDDTGGVFGHSVWDSGTIVLAVAGAFTLMDFLYALPRTVQSDVSTGQMSALFASPIPTGEIVSDVRRFSVALNLKQIAPAILLLAVMFLSSIAFGNFYSWNLTARTIGDWLVYAALWWLILETGVAAAALPRWVTDTAAHFVLFIVPLFILAQAKGTHIYNRLWFLLFPGAFPHRMVDTEQGYSRAEPTDFYWLWVAWLVGFRVLVILAPAIILFFSSRKLMELRRSGRWS